MRLSKLPFMTDGLSTDKYIRLFLWTVMCCTKAKRQIVLNKGREKFVFRYEAGSEEALLDAVIAQAVDKRTSFDWFDAAVLSFRLVQSLMQQADELLQEDSAKF